MSALDPGMVAAIDQAMGDATRDLDETIVRVRDYLAAGHDPAEAFLSLLTNFRTLMDMDRPELLAGTAAAAILRLVAVAEGTDHG